MKTFIFSLLLIASITIGSAAQTGCDPSLNSSLPPSPYVDGFLTFDGSGDFLRSGDLNQLEFPYNSTDSFSIQFSIKIDEPFRPMNIFGKHRSAGWIIGYHSSESGYLSIYINNTWKRIYYLGADTTWHSYEIRYNKSTQTLMTMVDKQVTNTYTEFTYSSMADNSAFSVGNVGFFAQYGPQSVNLTSYWFKGSISYLRINSNTNCLVNYGFNEGGGQVARDSLTYFYSDRTYPGSSTCGTAHMMLGYMPAEDTCDPVWSAFDHPANSRFAPLGDGTQYWFSNSGMEYYAEHFSTAMTVWNNKLINTGYFNLAGGNEAKFIAAWDGNSWSPLGSGLNHEALGLRGYNGELYAVGFFDTAGGVPAKYIARWNGTVWRNAGEQFNNIANTLYEFDGKLIAGGWFTSIGDSIISYVASWDGNQWSAMNTGMNGPVYALCEYRGELYAAGKFTIASGVPAGGIVKWTGHKWMAVGTGVTGGEKAIYTLEVYNDELYAGGSFIKMGDTFCYNIAKYDGTNWSATGSGADGAMCNVSRGIVSALKVCNNELYAAGSFSRLNDVIANKLAKFNGTNWCSVEYGVDLRPRALEVYNNDLIINGDFYTASGVAANNIVKYTPVRNLTGIQNNNNIPKDFRLEQNYPNPFNPQTKINYNIAEFSRVTLRVFDITGKETAVLVNKDLNAGAYSESFNASGLATGVYIYRLEAKGKDGVVRTESKKMVLIK